MSDIQYGDSLAPHQRQTVRPKWYLPENKYRMEVGGFKCHHCQAYVNTQAAFSGVNNRNHCPYCLWSRHMDHTQPGDRMSACKANMQPIGLTMKRSRNKYCNEMVGELMLVHRCSECGKLSISRIAADDIAEVVLAIYRNSLEMDQLTYSALEGEGIRMLQANDIKYIQTQLIGER